MSKVKLSGPFEVPLDEILRPELKKHHLEDAKRYSKSIASYTLLQPIGLFFNSKTRLHEVVWGRRRLEAFHILGRRTIPAYSVKADTLTLSELGYVENEARETTFIDECITLAGIHKIEQNTAQISVRLGVDLFDCTKMIAIGYMPEHIHHLLLENEFWGKSNTFLLLPLRTDVEGNLLKRGRSRPLRSPQDINYSKVEIALKEVNLGNIVSSAALKVYVSEERLKIQEETFGKAVESEVSEVLRNVVQAERAYVEAQSNEQITSLQEDLARVNKDYLQLVGEISKLKTEGKANFDSIIAEKDRSVKALKRRVIDLLREMKELSAVAEEETKRRAESRIEEIRVEYDQKFKESEERLDLLRVSLEEHYREQERKAIKEAELKVSNTVDRALATLRKKSAEQESVASLLVYDYLPHLSFEDVGSLITELKRNSQAILKMLAYAQTESNVQVIIDVPTNNK